MCDHLKCKFDGPGTSFTLAKSPMIICYKMFMKLTKHSFNLLVYFFQVRFFTIFIKKDRIAFDLGYFKSNLVCINYYFKQLLYDMPAMVDLHFIHKTSEAADIRNKYEASVFHPVVKLDKKTTRN